MFKPDSGPFVAYATLIGSSIPRTQTRGFKALHIQAPSTNTSSAKLRVNQLPSNIRGLRKRLLSFKAVIHPLPQACMHVFLERVNNAGQSFVRNL